MHCRRCLNSWAGHCLPIDRIARPVNLDPGRSKPRSGEPERFVPEARWNERASLIYEDGTEPARLQFADLFALTVFIPLTMEVPISSCAHEEAQIPFRQG
jgi:hypothetical protein